MASQKHKVPVNTHFINDEDGPQNIDPAGGLKQRRSSILKPPRSPPKSPRLPLSEVNRVEREDGRKSLSNKRVSFAAAPEITEFLTEYNGSSKDFEGCEEINTEQLSMHPQTLMQYQCVSGMIIGPQGNCQSQQIYDENLDPGDSQTGKTRFFKDASAQMFDVTCIGDEFLDHEEFSPLQANITDNAPEDMSLTLNINILPKNTDLFEVFANDALICADDQKSKKELTELPTSERILPKRSDFEIVFQKNHYTLDSKEAQFLVSEEEKIKLSQASEIKSTKNGNFRVFGDDEISDQDGVTNKSFFVKKEEELQFRFSDLEMSNSCIEQPVGNSTIMDEYKPDEASYVLDSSLKYPMVSDMSIAEKEMDHLSGHIDMEVEIDPMDKSISNSRLPLTVQTVENAIPVALFQDTLYSCSMNLTDVDLDHPGVDVTNHSCSMDLTGVETGHFPAASPCNAQLVDVGKNRPPLALHSDTRYSSPMDLTDPIEETEPEIKLNVSTLSALYSPQHVSNDIKENIHPVVDLIDHGQDLIVSEMQLSRSNISIAWDEKQIEVEPIVLNSECLSSTTKKDDIPGEPKVMNIVQEKNNQMPSEDKTDCLSIPQEVKYHAAHPKVRTNSSANLRKAPKGLSYMNKKFGNLAIGPQISSSVQCKVNLEIPKVVILSPEVKHDIQIAGDATPRMEKNLPVEKKVGAEKAKDYVVSASSTAVKSTDTKTNLLNKLQTQNLFKSPSRIPIRDNFNAATPSKSEIPSSVASADTFPVIPQTVKYETPKLKGFPLERGNDTSVGARKRDQVSTFKPKEDLFVFTTPSQQRSVALHNCAHSSSKKMGKHGSTPISAKRKPPVKKTCPANRELSAVKNVDSEMRLSAKRIPGKHCSTPISQRRRPLPKKTCTGYGSNFINSYSLNTDITLIDGFSIDSIRSDLPEPSKMSFTNSQKCEVEPLHASFKANINERETPSEKLPTVSDISIVSSTSSSKAPELKPTVNNCAGFGSPALGMRKKDLMTANYQLSSAEVTPSHPDSHRALKLDFHEEMLDSTVSDISEASPQINPENLMRNNNFTFTQPDRKLPLTSQGALGLKEEVENRLKTEGLEDWTYTIPRGSKGVVHFFYLNKLFYLAVQCGQDVSEGCSFSKTITSIQIKTKYSDEIRPQNGLVMKMVNHHLKSAPSLNSFKTTDDLPELLESLTDPFFRGHCLMVDLRGIGTWPDITENEEGFEIELVIFNSVINTMFNLKFAVKFETYPFAAIRPNFTSRYGRKTEVFRLSAIQVTMNEKTGEKYLWRMWDAARDWLDAQVTQEDIDRQKRLLDFVFVI